jgi:ATP synthase F1 delta subunit
MNGHMYDLAKKYGKAFVNLYDHIITEQEYDAIMDLGKQLKKMEPMLIFLSIQGIAYNKKYSELKKILAASYFDQLICMLIKSNRVILLPEVLMQIAYEYYRRHSIIVCAIVSTCSLTLSEIDAIIKFLTVQVKSTIKYECFIDPKLIAGIRVYSQQFIWEYSIRKELQQIERMFA